MQQLFPFPRDGQAADKGFFSKPLRFAVFLWYNGKHETPSSSMPFYPQKFYQKGTPS
jgi:hypothetical protein